MASTAREYIDFWIENSVHAVEQFRDPGASQDVTLLVDRLIEDAKAQSITEQRCATRSEISPSKSAASWARSILPKVTAANERRVPWMVLARRWDGGPLLDLA
jgi:hypothetical protein